ncbi:DUF1540 domain-containing protein [Melissospora conviva]|uniref:DUF1540 domain-containing protein n=1 Tax=Melissospora conviva TaxID=3388432 RepID=UPI003B820963
MTAVLEMPRVQQCTATSCSYNAEEECRAFAITIGTAEHAHCDTFFDSPQQGGVTDALAQVGACKRSDCVHNSDLECHAPAISVGSDLDLADCVTYQPQS